MAKIMSYTVPYPNGMEEDYPSSYWRCTSCEIRKEEGIGRIIFSGFPSEAMKGTRIIGQKLYNLTAEQYAAFSQTALDAITAAEAPRPVVSLQDALMKQAYLYADSVLDVDSGQVDADGNPVMVGFFHSATDV